MEALFLSYLYLFIDDSETATEVGAGDLATSNLPTGLSRKSVFFKSTHQLLVKLYNCIFKGSLPGAPFNIPNFFVYPSIKIVFPSFSKTEEAVGFINDTLNKIIPSTSESVINYHYLWYTYLNGRFNVTVFCSEMSGRKCDNYISHIFRKNKKEIRINYKIPTMQSQLDDIEKLRNKTINGVLLEGELNKHPCLDEKIINTFKIKEICQLLKLTSKNSDQFLKMMKYVIQSPVYFEEEDEYFSTFKQANLTENGFFLKENKV